jgi:hypothetical protein
MAEGQKIGLTAEINRTLRHKSGALAYKVEGVDVLKVADHGSIHVGAGSLKVVGTRMPGWANYTGAQLRTTPVPGTTTPSDLIASSGRSSATCTPSTATA